MSRHHLQEVVLIHFSSQLPLLGYNLHTHNKQIYVNSSVNLYIWKHPHIHHHLCPSPTMPHTPEVISILTSPQISFTIVLKLHVNKTTHCVSFVSGFFPFPSCSEIHTLCVAIYSFFLLGSMLLFGDISICLSVILQMHIWVVSHFGHYE